MTVFQAYWALMLPTTAIAAIWGGRWERTVAAMTFAAAILTLAARTTKASRYHDVEMGVMAVDLALTIGLVWVAVRCAARWPSWIAALQCISTLAHLGKATEPTFWRFGYAVMSQAAAWPGMVILLYAVWRHRVASRHDAETCSRDFFDVAGQRRPRRPPDG